MSAWTVEEACEAFREAGVPVDPDPGKAAYRFRLIVRGLQLQPSGRAPSPGPQGGRGQDRYPIADLQRIHSALSPWLTRGPSA